MKIACKVRKSAMNSSKVVDGGMLICLFQRKHVDLYSAAFFAFLDGHFYPFNHGLFQMILQGFARISPKKRITPGKHFPKDFPVKHPQLKWPLNRGSLPKVPHPEIASFLEGFLTIGFPFKKAYQTPLFLKGTTFGAWVGWGASKMFFQPRSGTITVSEMLNCMLESEALGKMVMKR